MKQPDMNYAQKHLDILNSKNLVDGRISKKIVRR